jgi:tRNA(Met) cytidine acetyltransferase
MSTELAAGDLQSLRLLIAAATGNRHRYPLLVAGSTEHNHVIAQALCAEFFPASLWLGDAPPAWNGTASPSFNAAQMLGQEFDAVVFDACAGLHPDALGVAAGLVRAGGLLLLLAPAPENWAQFDDPDYRRLMNVSELSQSSRFFLQRLCTRHLPELRIVDTVLQPLPAIESFRKAQGADAPYASADQRDAVAALQRVVTGHRRRPLVLTADRGRGKSAAIGIACAQLLLQGKKKLVITAARPAMAQAALQHAQQLLPDSVREGDVLEWQQARIRFVAPDALLFDQTVRDVVDGVFVDEAAALPVPLLTKLLQKFSRIAFVSTIHGYEGNGRGFALRFTDELKRQTPQFRTLQLSQPIRWNAGDPLEQWVNRLLCLDADVPEPVVADDEQISVREVDRVAWLSDEEKLRELFALLVLAHYQTTPSDLRFLLDAPGIRLFVATAKTQLLGAAITMAEGVVGDRMHEAIITGRRRMRGHLVAQRLAVDTGAAEWLMLRGLRISRVVVHPSWQRRHVGEKLLHCVEQCAQSGADYLSTSFGATASLLQFWRHSGFTAARLGFTREQASGEHALIMVKPLTERTRGLVDMALARWHEAFAFQLRAEFSTLDSELVVELLQRRASTQAQAHHLEIASRFAAAHLQLADSQWALWPCVIDASSSPRLAALDAIDRNLLVAVVLQQQSLSKVARQLGFNTNAEAESALRSTVAHLLQP